MNKEFLEKAVELSERAVEEGKFPAGAVIVKDGQVVAEETSSVHPNQHLHAVTKLIDALIAETKDQLGEYEVYTSLAPCMMCTGKIYWSGVKKVYYVLSRDDVKVKPAYEGQCDFEDIVSNLNSKIEFVQDKTFFKKALEIYKNWESK